MFRYAENEAGAAGLIYEDNMSKVVILGMSGGVDSTMALKMLKKEYDKVIGVNHIVYKGVKSSSKEVLERAENICRNEGIPFYVMDLTTEFKECVIDNFINSYIEGTTPNPCVICNRKIKFTAFFEAVKKMLFEKNEVTAEDELFYSTGHYVRTVREGKNLFLKRSLDRTKDQSYMLYRLSQDILSRSVFPLGKSLKKDIVEKAASEGLPFRSIKESQDICFIEGEYTDFIKEKSSHKSRPGKILDTKGEFLGKHRGYVNYTIGQRKGLGLGNGPWFVVKIEPETNTVVVGRAEEQGIKEFEVEDLNWFIDFEKGENKFPLLSSAESDAVPEGLSANTSSIEKDPSPYVRGTEETGEGYFTDGELRCYVQVRYGSAIRKCRVGKSGGGRIRVILDEKAVITPGQSAVFYSGDIVLGGGIISRY